MSASSRKATTPNTRSESPTFQNSANTASTARPSTRSISNEPVRASGITSRGK